MSTEVAQVVYRWKHSRNWFGVGCYLNREEGICLLSLFILEANERVFHLFFFLYTYDCDFITNMKEM